jgi:rubrerythrin
MNQLPEIVAAVHAAIDREKDAIKTYLRLAKVTQDGKARSVLISIATDEVGHMEKLEGHLTALLQGKAWILPKSDLASAVSAALTPSMTLEKVNFDALGQADELKVLELALDAEHMANRAYLEMAEKAQGPDVKEMFLALAKEETVHAKILRAEIDAITENGFWLDMQEFTVEMEK